jgi:hypothetical protein
MPKALAGGISAGDWLRFIEGVNSNLRLDFKRLWVPFLCWLFVFFACAWAAAHQYFHHGFDGEYHGKFPLVLIILALVLAGLLCECALWGMASAVPRSLQQDCELATAANPGMTFRPFKVDTAKLFIQVTVRKGCLLTPHPQQQDLEAGVVNAGTVGPAQSNEILSSDGTTTSSSVGSGTAGKVRTQNVVSPSSATVWSAGDSAADSAMEQGEGGSAEETVAI